MHWTLPRNLQTMSIDPKTYMPWTFASKPTNYVIWAWNLIEAINFVDET